MSRESSSSRRGEAQLARCSLYWSEGCWRARPIYLREIEIDTLMRSSRCLIKYCDTKQSQILQFLCLPALFCLPAHQAFFLHVVLINGVLLEIQPSPESPLLVAVKHQYSPSPCPICGLRSDNILAIYCLQVMTPQAIECPIQPHANRTVNPISLIFRL